MNTHAHEEFVIPDSTLEEAVQRMASLSQQAELHVRQQNQYEKDMYERIKNEVIARLNKEVHQPDFDAAMKIIKSVFIKHLGPGTIIMIDTVDDLDQEQVVPKDLDSPHIEDRLTEECDSKASS